MKKLEKIGYNRDIQLNEEEWKEQIENTEKSSKSLATVMNIEEPTYRDSKTRKSIELKDYRKRDFEADYVAELEHFNPEKRPISHLIVDFPLWLWKNRIKNQKPKQT